MIWLIFAHYISDCGLQNEFTSQNKGKYPIIMFSHCMIWTGCLAIALQYLGIFSLWKVLFLVGGHWICDQWKCNRIEPHWQQNKKAEKWNLRLLYTDQAWHLMQCLIVYLIK